MFLSLEFIVFHSVFVFVLNFRAVQGLCSFWGVMHLTQHGLGWLAFASAYFSCNFSAMNHWVLTGVLEAAETLCSENNKSIVADSELTENHRI